ERVGEAFGGTIVTVTEFGVFVELDDIHVQGLLHVSRLGSDYYKWVPNLMSLVGARSGHRFSLGQRLRVVVEDVSVELGRVNLRAEAPKRKQGVRRRRRKKVI
ncbi:MAG TPA: ribonuclease R, partial [Gammaproteobacteria bacterium]|nr:ribonuclease R [Gammaproteobacteria bacterium]